MGKEHKSKDTNGELPLIDYSTRTYQGEIETEATDITIRGASLRQCYAYLDKTLRRVEKNKNK